MEEYLGGGGRPTLGPLVAARERIRAGAGPVRAEHLAGLQGEHLVEDGRVWQKPLPVVQEERLVAVGLMLKGTLAGLQEERVVEDGPVFGEPLAAPRAERLVGGWQVMGAWREKSGRAGDFCHLRMAAEWTMHRTERV